MNQKIRKCFILVMLMLSTGFLLSSEGYALTEQWQANFLPNSGTSYDNTSARSIEANDSLVVVAGGFAKGREFYLVNAYDAKTGQTLWTDDADYILPDYAGPILGSFAYSVSFSPDGSLVFVDGKFDTDGSTAPFVFGQGYFVRVYEAMTGKIVDRIDSLAAINPGKASVNNRTSLFCLQANNYSGGTEGFSKVVAYDLPFSLKPPKPSH